MKKKIINIRSSTGEVVQDPQEVANLFGEHFSVAATGGGSDPSRGLGDRDGARTEAAHSFFLFPTDTIEVNSAIKQASVKHSAGYDDIPCSLLSSMADVLTEPLTSLFNACIVEEIFPDYLKVSKVLPIHRRVILWR